MSAKGAAFSAEKEPPARGRLDILKPSLSRGESAKRETAELNNAPPRNCLGFSKMIFQASCRLDLLKIPKIWFNLIRERHTTW